MIETYERLRDSASGEVGAAWKAADREESNLRTLSQELFDVITGRMPRQVERRWWNRAVETPVLGGRRPGRSRDGLVLPASRQITASGGTTSARCGRLWISSPTTARGARRD